MPIVEQAPPFELVDGLVVIVRARVVVKTTLHDMSSFPHLVHQPSQLGPLDGRPPAAAAGLAGRVDRVVGQVRAAHRRFLRRARVRIVGREVARVLDDLLLLPLLLLLLMLLSPAAVTPGRDSLPEVGF